MSFIISPLPLIHSSIIRGVVNGDVGGRSYNGLRDQLRVALQKAFDTLCINTLSTGEIQEFFYFNS
jgi:hypothetical protein